MDDERPTNPLVLFKTPALWLGGIVGCLVVVATLVLVAWDLFVAPVWGMKPLSFGEAIGASIFIGMYVGVGYILKEDSE